MTALLRGADLAALAVALVARLRSAGVRVSADGPAVFVQGLRQRVPRTRSELYWVARVTLVNRGEDLPVFDAVFDAVFGQGRSEPNRAGPGPSLRVRAEAAAAAADAQSRVPQEAGLPWVTRAAAMTARDDADDAVEVPEALPSHIVARATEPFDRFDPQDLRLLGSWLETTARRWPRRRSLRRELNRRGKRIDLRRTMNASRKTGWEPVTLARTRRRARPRRIVLVCDVSRSMQPYATIYLHLMRAAAQRRAGIRPEVFAFSTSLTRLTAVLSQHSPETTLERVNAKVTDRYGGTRLGRSVRALLASAHGNALRGAVVIIASDGWDSDPPEVVEHALSRIRRRAALLVWLNPRAAHPGFRPLAASMAAALPYCDVFTSAHSLAGLHELFGELASRG